MQVHLVHLVTTLVYVFSNFQKQILVFVRTSCATATIHLKRWLEFFGQREINVRLSYLLDLAIERLVVLWLFHNLKLNHNEW